jgi:glutamate-1-semialdehyde-2,1-aminomutase
MNKRYTNSIKNLERSKKVIPLGSQTFSKSYTQFPLGHSPLYIERGKGARVWDIDGNEYVDLVCGLLPVILGYCDPDVDSAIKKQLEKGITFSLPSILETELAETLVEIIPSAEMVRFGKNGTDATSAAIRLARAYTGRDHIIALGYHGWQDWYIGSTTRSKGVPSSVSKLTHKLPFNDLDAIRKIFSDYPEDIAAIILEPMSSIEPNEGYLESLRDLTKKNNALLIFDEVITGFRYALGGAQELFNITPDLSCFGKGLGNGMPISAVVGKKEIMNEMEEVFFSGTFGGETLSLAAAIAVIDKMKKDQVIQSLWEKGSYLSKEVTNLIGKYNLSDVIKLSGKAPWKLLNFYNYGNTEGELIKTFYMVEMLKNGVLTSGSHNICYALNKVDLGHILSAYEKTFMTLSNLIKTGKLNNSLPCPIIRPVFNVRQSVLSL